MGLGSIILAVFAFLLIVAGVLATPVPFLGMMLSFLAPVLAIAGVVLGGVAMSRAKQGQGESEGLATAGLVLNIIAFVPAMLVAVTCGLCNTMCTGMYMDPSEPGRGVPWDRDGGAAGNPFEDLFDPPDAGPPTPLPALPPTAPTGPMHREGDDTPLPPPPLPPGPVGSGPVGSGPAPTPEPVAAPTADPVPTPEPETAPASAPTPEPAEEPRASRRRRR